ncbi:hypothetical protein TSUD_228110 [Trifolium subterraneum]|uniref:Integrase catalytic domain-containing protein n=1 Tax=Trifolium subterraneum TaxID=3900 RepID=A0A2Z6LR00_TRISU|nr:hypothetical protein TSUD_228110 [Trifolium subterraneum]
MAEWSNFAPPSIPKFDGYYDHWAMLMENLLRSKEYWSLIEHGIVIAPEGATQEQLKAMEESKLKDLKAKNYLFQAIDRSILETILSRNTAKEIWDSMRQKYQGESVDEFFARTLTIANKMTTHGENLTQGDIVEKILRSLTSRFNYVACSIEESHDVTTMSVDELQSSLIVHEKRMKGQQEQEEQVLKVSYGGRNNRGRGGGDRGRTQGGGRCGGGAKFKKENVEFFKCHKLGHFQSECPSREEENANYAQFDEGEEILLMAQETKETKEQGSHSEIWFLDSGCSNHMIGNKEWLFDFDDSFKDSVKLGDDSKMAVMGKGNLKLHIEGYTQVFTNVYYFPGLKNNLLSIGQLQEKNLTVIFRNDTCKVFHEEIGLIMSTHMSLNRMYVIRAHVIIPKCLKIAHCNESQVWHQRYGHLSYKGLGVLVSKKMVLGLPCVTEPTEKCSNCMKGKQHKEVVSKKSSWRASIKLELIHLDICGPITPESNGKKRYFITFIDDMSRKSWVYFLNEKSEALVIFQKFKIMVENATQHKIQCLRTDKGGEYTSIAFNEFCDLHGIRRQLTTTYTPKQNGVSERKNRTILNMVRCMLDDKKIPNMFWPETVNCENGDDMENHTSNDHDENINEVIVPDSEDSSDEAEEIQMSKRIPRKPSYLEDYVTNEASTDEEALQNLAIFTPGEDPITYDEAFKHSVWRKAMDSEIASIETVRNWYVFQLDVKSAFLHGELDEEVYVEQPLGYQKGKKDMVYRLKKSLYGLRQAPKACGRDKVIIVSLYVDDLIFTGNDQKLFDKFKNSIESNFAMTDLGKMRYFLGIEVVQNENGIFICQQKYASDILERFGMNECNSVSNPLVPGCKLQKDETARFMERPIEIHVAAVKRILSYLKGTTSHGLWYARGDESKLTRWSDSDYAGDLDDRKSTSGILGQIDMNLKECITIYCDNSSSIKLSINQVMHGRSKYIDMRFHFLRDLSKDGIVQLVHCSSFEQIADIMTKALSLENFCRHRDKLGLCKLETIN